MREGETGIKVFNWEIEFPEVFDRANRGFDAIFGNPPFAGKNTTIAPLLQKLKKQDKKGEIELRYFLVVLTMKFVKTDILWTQAGLAQASNSGT